ncbi:MAG: hypothetical protein IJ368_04950, partial [Oscillospiraceae bacterium]|nr:hypothetical protein [Oscillospiraceae bacterium]
WAYLFPKVLYWDWVSIIGEYRTLQRCGDYPREYRGVRLVFDVTYVITYCDYDWCDRQYEEYSGRYKSLQAAVDAVECCINYYRNRKITTPFNPETAELFSFSAKVHESYKEKEQGS